MTLRAGFKCLFMLLLAVSAGLLLADSAMAEEGKIVSTIAAGPYQLKDLDDGHQLHVEGFGSLLVPGKPLLPAQIFALAVPPGAEVTRVTFDGGAGITLPGKYTILPSPLHRVVGEEDPVLYERDKRTYEANHQAVYGSDAPYPSAAGEFVHTAGYRKYDLVDVRIMPFTYFPQSGRLVYHPEVKVEVDYTLPAESGEAAMIDHLPRTEKIASQIIHNYDQAQSFYPSSTTSSRGLYDFVIITLDSLKTAVQPLVDWEIAKGRTVNVVTTDWINTNYTGYDLAEKQRNFLRDKYPSAEWGIEDVLIVGHYDDVPMRRCEQDLGYGRPETDYYYAELSKPDNQSWDADQDRKWGENSDPIDFYVEVNVGRIPWSAVSTVQSICQKSVDYENNNELGFKQNILLLGGYFWADTDNAVLMEYKTNTSLHPWMADWTRTRMYEKNVDYTSTYPCDYELLRSNVMAHWPKEKYAFVNWAGHGSPTSSHIYGLGAPAFITSSDCPQLDDNYPAIIFADACSNSDTDYLNIGQAMLKQGAVGFVGATKVALGCPGWQNPNHGSSQSMDYYFTSSVTSGDYSQGAAHQFALRKMYTSGLWAYDRYEIFEWGALWGNPDLRLEYNPVLVLSFPEGLPEGIHPPGPETEMKIEINGGLENYVAGSGQLLYRFDSSDPYTAVPVTPLGGDLFEVTLPNTSPGCEPEYYFSALGDGGTTICSPWDAPATVYSFDVCFVETVMEDDFEQDKGWTVVNDPSLTTGAWERGDPVGTDAQPEDDHTVNGTMCFVTGRLGGSIGDHDVDGGPTFLYSPILDLSSGDANLSFYAWFYHSTNGTQQPLRIHLSNDGGTTWKLVDEMTNNPAWNYKNYKVSDYVTPTANVQLRFRATDNPNDSVVEALVDDFSIERYNYDPTLWADAYMMSCATGDVVDYSMDAGASNAGRNYLVLATLSGTVPGFNLPGGQNMPINWDAFTTLALGALGSPAFQNFMGALDGSGRATATFNTLGPVDPMLIGQTMSFAYLLSYPPGWDFTSNPVELKFDP